MRRTFYLLSLLLLQSLFVWAGNGKDIPSSLDLYVCIGQSNMAGRAIDTGSHGYFAKCVSVE